MDRKVLIIYYLHFYSYGFRRDHTPALLREKLIIRNLRRHYILFTSSSITQLSHLDYSYTGIFHTRRPETRVQRSCTSSVLAVSNSQYGR